MENIKETGSFQQVMSSIFALKLFQRLIEVNYSEDEETASPNCSMGKDSEEPLSNGDVKSYVSLGEALHVL